MPRSEDQFREIREEKVAIIKATALKLFAEDDFHTVSVSQIAKAANISKGLLYNYFESKEDLLQSIIFEGLDDLFEHFDPNHDGILEQHELIGYLELTCQHLRENSEFWKLYFTVMMQESVLQVLKPKLLDYSVPIFTMLETYFREKGYEKPEVEVVFFGSLLSGVVIKFLGSPDNYPLEEIKNKIIAIYNI